MSSDPCGISLTTSDLREVAAFAFASASEVLPLFESSHPDDPRPRHAIEAAREVVDGASRSKLQRISAPAAHRAAKEAHSPAAFHAAMAAGDAAASVYLHPLADAVQVGHILRSAAHAARAKELANPNDTRAAQDSLEQASRRATPALRSLLDRYPTTSEGSTRVAQLMHRLDVTLRNRSSTVELGDVKDG